MTLFHVVLGELVRLDCLVAAATAAVFVSVLASTVTPTSVVCSMPVLGLYVTVCHSLGCCMSCTCVDH